ncbi:MAG: molybdopterin-dependent oxidoreductase [Halodesulfurarchaeum sp.]
MRCSGADRSGGGWTEPVMVSGEHPLTLTQASLESFDRVSKRVTIVCASGETTTADWTGIPLRSLLDAADIPLETTHVTVASRDGYRVAVGIVDALGGLLATHKDGVPISREHPYENRFVAPRIDGARNVKGVSRIEPHSLRPHDHPESLENVDPDSGEFDEATAGAE